MISLICAADCRAIAVSLCPSSVSLVESVELIEARNHLRFVSFAVVIVHIFGLMTPIFHGNWQNPFGSMRAEKKSTIFFFFRIFPMKTKTRRNGQSYPNLERSSIPIHKSGVYFGKLHMSVSDFSILMILTTASEKS